MRKLILLFTDLVISCNYYGDIDLGSKFYSMVGPAFNSFAYRFGNGYKYIVNEKFESIAWDKDYILFSTKADSLINYWEIDKIRPLKDEDFKDDLNLKSFLSGPMDSIKWYTRIKVLNLELTTREYHQKKGGWVD